MNKEFCKIGKQYEVPILNITVWDEADIVTLSYGDNNVDDDFDFGA